jgi:prolyl-tRNA synthetase
VGGLVMTHSDDDGLVLPPRLAPKHVVILPVIHDEEDRATVMEYCQSLEKELSDQKFSTGTVSVMLDRRDMRGGEKKWYHVKRGVPVRLEIGKRDIDNDTMCVARRDTGLVKPGPTRAEFTATVGTLLDEIQDNLYQRALTLRKQHTQAIDTLQDFRDFFTANSATKPEIHGGFALCHWTEDPAVDELLRELKVSVRCVAPDEAEPGTCIFTGKPSQGRAVFAKAY